MDRGNLNIKMEISFKEIILKIRKEEKESTISTKVVFYNHNSIQILLKFQKYSQPMAQFMQENKKMVQDKVQEKQHTSMDLFMMVNG